MKTWKLWGISSSCFLFVGIMNLVEKEYLVAGGFMTVALSYGALSIRHYKSDKKTD